MTTEEIKATKRTKTHIKQEEARLAEAIRLQALQEKKAARQFNLEAPLDRIFKKLVKSIENLCPWKTDERDESEKKGKAFMKDKVTSASSKLEIENRPEKIYDRVLWGDLKTMFDPPLSDDAI
ncbi:hypothetical protein Tco_1400644 [Tanacetum coccineum]